MSKTILITGASTGLGAATAVYLAEGNSIYVHYNRSADKAKKVAEAVKNNGGNAELVSADLSSNNGCDALFNAVNEKCNSLDLLVNNAGGGLGRYGVADITWERMEKIFSLNTFSAIRLTALFVPLLKKGIKPSIVNIISVAARSGAPTATLYGAAKGALDTFTRGSAKELAPNIRVNSIAPGVFETPFHDNMTDKEKLDELANKTPLKMNGEPKHIAMTIKFLMENDFITGECIDVNGGLSMR